MDDLEETSPNDYTRIIDLIKDGTNWLDQFAVQSSQVTQRIDVDHSLEQSKKSFLTLKSKFNHGVNYIPMPHPAHSKNASCIGILNRQIRKRPVSSGNLIPRGIEEHSLQSLLSIDANHVPEIQIVQTPVAEEIPGPNNSLQDHLTGSMNGSQIHIGQSSSAILELNSSKMKTVTRHSNFPEKFCEEMFQHPEVSSDKKYTCYQWVTNREMSCIEVASNWIVMNYPQTLNISGSVVRQCLKLNGAFTVSMVDAIMVVWSSLDAKMTKYFNDLDDSHNIWRHFLPASFVEMVNDNPDYLNSDLIRSSFIGNHINYNVEHCRQIIVPVLAIDNTWSCYFWDFKDKSISVLDPVLQSCPKSKARDKHQPTVMKLHSALFLCKDKFFSGWHVSATGWNEFYFNKLSHRCSAENSGLYAVHYARTFCFGKNMLCWPLKMIHEPNLCYPRGEIMYHLVTCPENKGYKSEALKEKIQHFEF